MVEHIHGKDEVAGSIPALGSSGKIISMESLIIKTTYLINNSEIAEVAQLVEQSPRKR